MINTRYFKEGVDLWWPNGFGEQPLYTLRVQWESKSTGHHKADRSSKNISIGFRTIELVEEPARNLKTHKLVVITNTKLFNHRNRSYILFAHQSRANFYERFKLDPVAHSARTG